MVLHLGENVVVPIKDIIAIIDSDTVDLSTINKEFIKIAEEEGFVNKISENLTKSYILAEINKKSVVFLSPISSSTLLKRSNFTKYIESDE